MHIFIEKVRTINRSYKSFKIPPNFQIFIQYSYSQIKNFSQYFDKHLSNLKTKMHSFYKVPIFFAKMDIKFLNCFYKFSQKFL